MITNFEKALNRDEFPAYFRGDGDYFKRDPDWGTHLHIINWQGLCAFLKVEKNPQALLSTAFSKYLATITKNKKDAEDLLENIGCYYYMRKKNDSLRINDFDLICDCSQKERQIISNTATFLEQEIHSTQHQPDIENYNLSITKLINDGGPENIRNL
ncbi:hypothetical protein GIW45_26890 [Pseudomonas congelans]|uniref:hypothetical protein n=1 Tax=Pseudomonas congelans TaxID=200452 RepID=UPI001F2DA474|nr:hypothetical protein [Pseudomonas congelans]MCF5167555.1 hypothetical protein [Pseudomonas congelans]